MNGGRICQLEFSIVFYQRLIHLQHTLHSPSHFNISTQITIENFSTGKCDAANESRLKHNRILQKSECDSFTHLMQMNFPFGRNGDHNRKFQKTMVKNWEKKRFVTLRAISASFLPCLLATTIILFADIKSCLYEQHKNAILSF